MRKIFVLFFVLLLAFTVSCGKEDNLTGGGHSSNTVFSDETELDDVSDTDKESYESEADTTIADTDAEDTEKVTADTDEEPDTGEGYTSTDDSGTLVIYPEFPEQVRRIYDYRVSVTMGNRTKSIPVYNHTVESNVSRRDGVDMYRRFAMFAFGGGKVRVDIKVNMDFSKYTVFPSAKNFKSDFKDGVISVYLDKPDYFGIQLDDDQNSIISVFADLPETDIPSKDDPNVVYIDGWYTPESGTIIYDKPNTVIYIAPGAVFNARIKVLADNCKVLGRGAIVDPFENIYKFDIQNGGTESRGFNLLTLQGNNLVCDGPVLLDARCFNIVFGGKNNTVRNMKALSSMMTTDGITSGAKESIAEHIWIYCGDNGIVPSNAENTTFRDISIGTTCAALFPQLNCVNVLFEDINVFRADDGVITSLYNSSGQNKVPRNHSIIFRRISAVEIPEKSTFFLKVGNMGNLQKTYTFEKISLPKMLQTVYYRNDSATLYSENYTLNFIDYFEDGKVAKSISDMIVKRDSESAKTTETFKVEGAKPVTRNEKKVSYSAEKSLYIGMLQVFTKDAHKVEGGKIMLPTKEICKLLRITYDSDEKYVSGDALVKAGLVEKVSERHGTVYITPKYKGENLILPDEGEISRFAENTCYDLDLTTSKDKDGYIYNVLNIDTNTAGISRSVSDEFRMYGEGTYRITYKARSDSENAVLALRLQYSKNETLKTFVASSDWKEYTFDFSITSEHIEATKNVIVFNSPAGVYKNFFIRDVTMTKIK